MYLSVVSPISFVSKNTQGTINKSFIHSFKITSMQSVQQTTSKQGPKEEH